MKTWMRLVPSGLSTVFLLIDAMMKVVEAAPAVQATIMLGYAADVVRPIGIIELVCLVLYILPHTATLGAVLLTAYLGGAVASQLRIGASLWTQTLFPVYVAVFVWLGLVMRDQRVRSLFPYPTRR